MALVTVMKGKYVGGTHDSLRLNHTYNLFIHVKGSTSRVMVSANKPVVLQYTSPQSFTADWNKTRYVRTAMNPENFDELEMVARMENGEIKEFLYKDSNSDTYYKLVETKP